MVYKNFFARKIHIEEFWKVYLYMRHNARLIKECKSCNVLHRHRFGFTCDACGLEMCNLCITYSLFGISICVLCATKAFLMKVTLPGGYDNLSAYEIQVGRIHVTSIKKGIIRTNSGTCSVCKKKNIQTLKRNFASLYTHYITKNKIRFKCKGSNKLNLEVRNKLLSGIK